MCEADLLANRRIIERAEEEQDDEESFIEPEMQIEFHERLEYVVIAFVIVYFLRKKIKLIL